MSSEFNKTLETKTAQQKANHKQDSARKGYPTFSPVRFKDEDAKKEVVRVINRFGGTREAALIEAFKALDEKLGKE